MNVVSEEPIWQLLGRIQALPGYGYGNQYPSLLVSFEGLPLSSDDQNTLRKIFGDSCPNTAVISSGQVSAINDLHQSADWLLQLWQTSQAALGLPVYEAGKILARSATQIRCVVPTLRSSLHAMGRVIAETIKYLNLQAEGEVVVEHENRLKLAIKTLSGHSAKGSNVPRFVKAAYELGIPFQELPGGAYQYGYGQRARWLDSSFTDVTSTISAKLSRSKVSASALLRQAGLPTPTHQLVPDADTAVKAAHQLTYPVVVKPADLDGGIGVAPGLLSDDDVREAFDNAQKHSKNILVEKHVEGRDYRLTVFNGAVIWAIERIPAGVTGDGESTVAKLVDTVNADPRRGTGRHAPLKRLLIDEEANRLLEAQALKITSIPESGQFVRLRRAANVASGGAPVAVFDQIHPDNARLAVRAAEVLRLDLAGIDLLIPDISISWRDSGAAICEVNGQPNLGQTTAAHLYPAILKQLISRSGRVPTILVVGAAQPEIWLSAFARKFSGAGIKAGLVKREEVSIGGEIIHMGRANPFEGGKMMALHRDVGGIVIAVEDFSLLRTGLPMSCIDAVVLAGTNLRSDDPRAKEDPHRWLAELLLCLLPACDGVIVSPYKQWLKAAGLKNCTKAAWHEIAGEVGQICDQILELVRQLALSREGKMVKSSLPSTSRLDR